MLRVLRRIVVRPLLLAVFGRLPERLYIVAFVLAVVVGAALIPLWLRLMAAAGTWYWVPLLVGWVALNRLDKEIFFALCDWVVEKAKPSQTRLRGREMD